MNPFVLSSSAERTSLLITLFLSLIFMLGLLFVTFTKRAKRPMWYVNMALFVMAFLLLNALSAEHTYIENGLPMIFRSPIPIGMLWCAAAIPGIYALGSILYDWRRRKGVIDRNSIKEAMDTLPAAVCYFTGNGMIKLCNLQMHRLFAAMTQSDLQSLGELHEALDGCDEHTGIIKLSGDEPVYLFPDGKAWLFIESHVHANDGGSYTEAVFYDVTELYEKKMELEAQTVKLRRLGESIRRLSENVVAMTREEEMLSFKTALHDRMGAGLVAARQTLTQNRSTAEVDELIHEWKRSVELVKRDNASPRGDYADLMRDAAAIGVKLCLDGSLPPDGEAMDVCIGAMRECLTNCVKHAHGTELTICLSEGDGNYVLNITNDGDAPKGDIVSGGGLGNLKRQVERCGGEMQIQSKPRFSLTVTIPKERRILQ